jgi:hypothetical protein
MPHMVHSATTTAQDLEPPRRHLADTTPAQPHVSQPDAAVGAYGSQRDLVHG